MQKFDFSMIFDTKFLRRKVIALIAALGHPEEPNVELSFYYPYFDIKIVVIIPASLWERYVPRNWIGSSGHSNSKVFLLKKIDPQSFCFLLV